MYLFSLQISHKNKNKIKELTFFLFFLFSFFFFEFFFQTKNSFFFKQSIAFLEPMSDEEREDIGDEEVFL